MSEKYLSKNCQLKVEGLTEVFNVGLEEKQIRHFLNEAIDKPSREKKTYVMLNSFIVNSYLSGFATPVANAASVFLQSIIKPMTYAIGAITDGLGATKQDRHLLDVLHMVESSLEGFASDFRFFNAGFKSGKPLDIGGTIQEMARAGSVDYKQMRKSIIDYLVNENIKVQRQKGSTLSDDDLKAAFLKQVKREKGSVDKFITDYLGENYDYITNIWPQPIGKIIDFPTRLSVSVDEYGKARLRRMKIAEMASRKARADAKAGKGKYADLYRQYQKLSLDGTNDSGIGYRDIQKSFAKMQKSMGKLFGEGVDDLMPYTDVKEFALDNTFQSRLHGILDKVARSRHTDSYMSTLFTLFVPFIKTPWNILKEGSTYIPVMPYVFRPKYVKGKEVVPMSQDELLPRQVLGASLFAGIFASYSSGYITGTPRDANEAQKWRDAGIQPQSLLIGDTWVSYARLEPVATVLGLAADLTEAYDRYVKDESPDKEIADYGVFEIMNALKTNILSKSFVEGFATLAEGLTQPDRQWEAFINTAARPLTPAILNQVARIKDDYERQATSIGEKMQQRIPFFREQLPMDYSAYSGARKTDKTQAVSGFYTLTEDERTQVQKEVEETGVSIMRPSNDFKSVKLDNEQLAVYRGLSSEYVGMYLNKAIQSPSYINSDLGMKRKILERYAAVGRQRASKEVFNKWYKEDPVFARKFMMELQQRQGLLAEAPLR